MTSIREKADKKKNEGNQAFKNQDYDLAIKLYTEAINIDPSSHVYFSNRSAAFSGKGEFEKAISDGQECIRLNVNFVKGYHRLATAQKGVSDYKEALDTLKRGQKIDFNNKDLNKLMSEIEPLAAQAEKIKRSGLPKAEQLKLKGNDAFKLAQFDSAIQFYTDALNEMSNKTTELAISCYNNRAACNQQMSNYSAVIEDCSCVLEFQNNNQKALLRRALAYEGLERYRLALQDIRHLLSINPNIEVANKAQHRIGQAVRLLKKQNT